MWSIYADRATKKTQRPLSICQPRHSNDHFQPTVYLPYRATLHLCVICVCLFVYIFVVAKTTATSSSNHLCEQVRRNQYSARDRSSQEFLLAISFLSVPVCVTGHRNDNKRTLIQLGSPHTPDCATQSPSTSCDSSIAISNSLWTQQPQPTTTQATEPYPPQRKIRDKSAHKHHGQTIVGKYCD